MFQCDFFNVATLVPLYSAHFQSSIMMLFEKTVWQVALRDRFSQADFRAEKFV